MCTSQYMVLQIQLMIFNSVSVREEQVYISRSWKGWMNAVVQCLGFFHMSYYCLLFNHFVCLFWAFWPWHSVLSNLKLKYQICGLQPRSGESVLCTGAPGLPRKNDLWFASLKTITPWLKSLASIALLRPWEKNWAS